jgi:hypothetical protein
MSALFFDNLTFATASRTGCGSLHLAEHGIHDPGYLASSVAGGASVKAGAMIGAGSFAISALHIFIDLDFFLNAIGNFFQGEFYLDAQVTTFIYPASPAG